LESMLHYAVTQPHAQRPRWVTKSTLSRSHRMIRSADAGYFALPHPHPRNLPCGIQNERKRPREQSLHDAVREIIDHRIARNIREIGTDKAHGMIVGDALHSVQLRERFFLPNVAAEPVNGVGRIDDDAAVFERLNNALDFAGLRMSRVYLK